LTTTVDQELKSKVQEKTDRNINQLVEEKFRQVLEEQGEEGETVLTYTFDWRPFTPQQRKVALFALKQLKGAHEVMKKKEIVTQAKNRSFYSSDGYAKSAVDKLVLSEIPVETVKNPETIGPQTKLHSVEIQCTNHTVDAASLMKNNEHTDRGECHICGHVFEGLQR